VSAALFAAGIQSLIEAAGAFDNPRSTFWTADFWVNALFPWDSPAAHVAGTIFISTPSSQDLSLPLL
jgi:hypothetical protein